MKSFRAKNGPDDPTPPDGRNPDANFRGEKRSNATHASASDPDAKLYRKRPGMQARLCFMGPALMENRSGLLVDTRLTRAGGHAERLAALAMIEPLAERLRLVTLGADRGYDAADFVNELRTLNVRPHVAQNTTRRSASEAARHAGYEASQRIRKRIEEAFGWMKNVGGMRRPMLRDLPRVGFAFTLRPPPTTSCVRRGSWRKRHREGVGQPGRGPLAHRRGRPLGARSSRPLPAPRAWWSEPMATARSPSKPCRPASMSTTAPTRSAPQTV